mmetsp:Transcript_116445/g.276772  ORF Transcript_116445/g.276772 Transcript_116445/m.276772 type:complete len:306 (-) Transcript_116445:1192-2109(-)
MENLRIPLPPPVERCLTKPWLEMREVTCSMTEARRRSVRSWEETSNMLSSNLPMTTWKVEWRPARCPHDSIEFVLFVSKCDPSWEASPSTCFSLWLWLPTLRASASSRSRILSSSSSANSANSATASRSMPSWCRICSRIGGKRWLETARAVKEDKATGKMMLYVRVPVSSSTMTTGVTGNLKQLAKSPTMPKISQAALASSPSTESGKTFPTNPPINPPEIKTGSRVSPGKRAETPSMKAPSLPRAKINKSTAFMLGFCTRTSPRSLMPIPQTPRRPVRWKTKAPIPAVIPPRIIKTKYLGQHS